VRGGLADDDRPCGPQPAHGFGVDRGDVLGRAERAVAGTVAADVVDVLYHQRDSRQRTGGLVGLVLLLGDGECLVGEHRGERLDPLLGRGDSGQRGAHQPDGVDVTAVDARPQPRDGGVSQHFGH